MKITLFEKETQRYNFDMDQNAQLDSDLLSSAETGLFEDEDHGFE